MTIQAFREDELAKIYKNKLIYSIIKYNKQKDNIKDFFEDKYMAALNLNNSSFDSDIFEEVVAYLEDEKKKYEDISNSNQEVIDILTAEIISNIKKEADKLPNDLEKCRFIFEYVSKTFIYDINTKKYNRDIPFGEDYDFEFYKGVPISKTFEGLLVTKTGLSDSISNLMIFLGNELGLNISSVACEYNDSDYIINSVKIDDNISYMDVSSVINGSSDIEHACLVDRATLISNNNYNGIVEEGITEPLDYSTSYDFTEIINMEKRILPEIEYVESNIFAK